MIDLKANEVNFDFLITKVLDRKKSTERYLFWEIPICFGSNIKK